MAKTKIKDAVQYALDFSEEVGEPFDSHSLINKPVSDEKIEAIEEYLGYELHKDFKYILQNYGDFDTIAVSFCENSFGIINATKACRENSIAIFGENNQFQDILNDCYAIMPNDDGDYWIQRKNGKIYYWNPLDVGYFIKEADCLGDFIVKQVDSIRKYYESKK